VYFEELHERIARAHRVIQVEYTIKNSSSVTATNLLVEFQTVGEVVVLADRDDAAQWAGSTAHPKPPKRPKTGMEHQIPSVTNLLRGIPRVQSRAPTDFYWQDRPEPGQRTASLICSEFRATREWLASIWLYPMVQLPFEGAIGLRITSSNLPAPVGAQATFRLEVEDARWTDSDVLSGLESWIADRLKAD
jgi:hypothetical protein